MYICRNQYMYVYNCVYSEEGREHMKKNIQENILEFLKRHEHKTLTEIQKGLEEDHKPLVLYHLKRLMELGKVVKNGDKTYDYYSEQIVSLIKIPYYSAEKPEIDIRIQKNKEPDYYVAIPPKMLKENDAKDLFIIGVPGDSMEPTLFRDSYVLFSKASNQIIKDNDMALFKLAGGELRIWRYKHMIEYAILWSDNFEKYPPIRLKDERDICLGKMVAVIR